MKKAISFFLVIINVNLAMAQNTTIAKFKFEEAEQAFVNNNYKQTISKLDEAEVLLKATNPKILHLKISAQFKLIEQNPYNDYKILENTKKLSANYLKEYGELSGNEDKFREIYIINEKLKKHPATREIFESHINQQKNIIEEKRIAELEKLKEFELAFMNFEYFKEYKLGLSVEETRKEYPELALKNAKQNNQSNELGELISSKKKIKFYVKNNIVIGYQGEIAFGSVKETFSNGSEYSKGDKIVNDIKNNLSEKFNFSPSVEKTGDSYYKKGKITSYSWIKNGKIIRLDINYLKKEKMMSAAFSYIISIYSLDENLAK